MSSIVEDWISRANAKQRRGRAGRVKPGMCFCMYTCHRFEKMMRPFQVIACHSSFIFFKKKLPVFPQIHQQSSLGPSDHFLLFLMLYKSLPVFPTCCLNPDIPSPDK